MNPYLPRQRGWLDQPERLKADAHCVTLRRRMSQELHLGGDGQETVISAGLPDDRRRGHRGAGEDDGRGAAECGPAAQRRMTVHAPHERPCGDHRAAPNRDVAE
jgi:hypothetical protein